MKLSTFFDTQFKVFSSLDNVRSIPSIIDGLKDSQRKAVYGMIQHGQSEIKVAQAAGKIALCLHKDTKIKVENEYYSIQTLYNNFSNTEENLFIETLNENNDNIEFDEVIDIIDKGESNDFIEITTEDDNNIIVTPDHKLLTDSGWKEAKNINDDDYILAME